MKINRIAKGAGGLWFALVVFVTAVFSVMYGKNVYAAEIPAVTWSYGGDIMNSDWHAVQRLTRTATSTEIDATGYGYVSIEYKFSAGLDSAGGEITGYGGVTAYAKSCIDDTILAESAVSPKTQKGTVVLNLNDVSDHVYIYVVGYIAGYRITARMFCEIVNAEGVIISPDVPTQVPIPTQAPIPTDVPTPTETPMPTSVPTQTPVPTSVPTQTPIPTDIPTPTDVPTPTVVPEPTEKIVINKQPDSTVASTDKSTGFSVSGVGIESYQWMTSTDGTNYVPITKENCIMANGVSYDGFNSPILIVSNIRLSENGRKYKCIVTGGGSVAESDSAVLTVQDKSAPIVSVSISPADKKSNIVTANITAVDIDSGLHDEAYSYDNGVTYLKDIRTQLIDKNGTYAVFVRDKAGNRAVKEYKIDNVDSSMTPVPTGTPTGAPTPTSIPTKVPTTVPTNVPTNVPTQGPTNPTGNPNVTPTPSNPSPSNPSPSNPVPSPTTVPVPNATPTNVPLITPTNIPKVTPTPKRPSTSSSSEKRKDNDDSDKKTDKKNTSSSSSSSSRVSVQTRKVTSIPAMEENKENLEIKTTDNQASLSVNEISGYDDFNIEEDSGLSGIIVAFIVLGGILLLALILFMLFFVATIQREEGYDDDYGDIRRMYEGKGALREDKIYRFLTFVRVRRKNGRWAVRIKDEIYEQGGLRLCLGTLFVALCEGSDIDILIGDSEQNEVIQKKTEEIHKKIVLN